MAARDSAIRREYLRQLELADAWEAYYDLEPESDLEVEDSYDSIFEERESRKTPTKSRCSKQSGTAHVVQPSQKAVRTTEWTQSCPEKARKSPKMDLARYESAARHQTGDERGSHVHHHHHHHHHHYQASRRDDKTLLDWLQIRPQAIPALIQEFRRSLKADEERLDIDAMKKMTLRPEELAKHWKSLQCRSGCEGPSRLRSMGYKKDMSKTMIEFFRENAASTSSFELVNRTVRSLAVGQAANRFLDCQCCHEPGRELGRADSDECDYVSYDEDSYDGSSDHNGAFLKRRSL